MFKNAIAYRIEQWTPPTAAQLEQRLAAARFIECGASQPESAGWIEPRGEAHAALLESVAGQWILKLGLETKAVPVSVVKTELGKRLDQAEKDTGSRPRGKRAKELKEDIVHALLPRAFPKRSDTLVWIDAEARLLLVGVGSVRRAERVVAALLQALAGDLKLNLLQTAQSPAVAMAAWLSEKEAPAGFTIDRDCELKQPDSEKSLVRYARHTLDIDEVGEHIRQGKLPTQLALTWRGRVSFVLTEALALKKIELLDLALEGPGAAAATARSADDDNGFDADVAIVTGELQQLIPDLVAALGGWLQPGTVSAMLAIPASVAAAPGRAPWDDAVSV
ncbi:MAG: recombination-associated protein RdgC [Pseudomonadota bacterium]|nr:recombination-associated protein RdgC [Pseudomonadota bacterium]